MNRVLTAAPFTVMLLPVSLMAASIAEGADFANGSLPAQQFAF